MAKVVVETRERNVDGDDVEAPPKWIREAPPRHGDQSPRWRKHQHPAPRSGEARTLRARAAKKPTPRLHRARESSVLDPRSTPQHPRPLPLHHHTNIITKQGAGLRQGLHHGTLQVDAPPAETHQRPTQGVGQAEVVDTHEDRLVGSAFAEQGHRLQGGAVVEAGEGLIEDQDLCFVVDDGAPEMGPVVAPRPRGGRAFGRPGPSTTGPPTPRRCGPGPRG